MFSFLDQCRADKVTVHVMYPRGRSVKIIWANCLLYCTDKLLPSRHDKNIGWSVLSSILSGTTTSSIWQLNTCELQNQICYCTNKLVLSHIITFSLYKRESILKVCCYNHKKTLSTQWNLPLYTNTWFLLNNGRVKSPASQESVQW